MFSKTKIPIVILLPLPRKETKGKYCFSLCNTQKDITSRQFISIVTVTYCIFLSLLNSLSKDVKERSLEQEKTRFQLCHFGLHSYKEVAIWSRKNRHWEVSFSRFLVCTFKGQLISEWIYEVIASPKIQTKNCQDFCTQYTRQKSWQFFVRIWGETMTS